MSGIAARLSANARSFPDKVALLFATGTRYEHKSYRQLDAESDAFAAGFAQAGIAKGTKTILMLKPGPELFSVVFALFKLGAVPVIVDPGMGVDRMLHCYRTVGAEAFIGTPLAHVNRMIHRRTFASVRVNITAGRRWFWGGRSLAGLAARAGEPPQLAAPADEDLLVINFTTGSTGPAKGVEYTHGMAEAMTRQIAETYRQSSRDVTLVTLPLFGIFDLLIGSTCVLPPVSPTKVAAADPASVVEAIEGFQVTTMFASPALLHTIGAYAEAAGIRLPSLRCVSSGGAPVADSIVARLDGVLGADARFITTYGATEALPISALTASEILTETRAKTHAGHGTCVGRPVRDIEVRTIRITDSPLPEWSPELVTAEGEVGEIVVAGPTVSPRYHQLPEANVRMKILDGERVWHRTGDLGWIDGQDRIWFCGRKSQRVHTAGGPLFSVQWEGVFNAHPEVYRTALVGVGPAAEQEPVLCVEPHAGVPAAEYERITAELRNLADANELTRGLSQILFHPGFPVDIRHNAKINREELANWAATRIAPAAPRSAKNTALRLIPIVGWAYLAYGLIWPFESPVLLALFWIDVFLSVVVHAAQLPLALPRGRKAGRGKAMSVFLTMLFGATWWKALPKAGDR